MTISGEEIILVARSTVGAMRMPTWLRDEAIDEGILEAVRAVSTWDGRGRIEGYIGWKVQHRVRDFLRKEYQLPTTALTESMEPPLPAVRNAEIDEFLAGLKEALDPVEFGILMWDAIGARRPEISRRFGMNALQIQELLDRVHGMVREYFLLDNFPLALDKRIG